MPGWGNVLKRRLVRHAGSCAVLDAGSKITVYHSRASATFSAAASMQQEACQRLVESIVCKRPWLTGIATISEVPPLLLLKSMA